jgi:hypothetical protein
VTSSNSVTLTSSARTVPGQETFPN